MSNTDESIIGSVIELSAKNILKNVLTQKYSLEQFIEMFVDAGKIVANYEHDRTEESDLRKICFSEENMKTLAKEMYSMDDFSWMNILEQKLDTILEGLETDNRRNCKQHFLQIISKYIRSNKAEIYERSMLVKMSGNVSDICDRLHNIENILINQEQTRQFQRQEGNVIYGGDEDVDIPIWTLAYNDVIGVFGNENSRRNDVIKLIDTWGKERSEYPGWYILPTVKCGELDIKTREFGLLQSYSVVDIDTMFDFCYEFVWRCEKCMHMYSKYEIDSIQTIWNLYYGKTNDKKALDEKWKFVGFSLLRLYREWGQKNKWDNTFEILKQCTSDDKCRLKLYLEKLKYEYYHLDITSMRRVLAQCKPRKEDYEARLQILGIRVEINDLDGIVNDIVCLIRDINGGIGDNSGKQNHLYLASLCASSLQLLSLCVQGISDYNHEYEGQLDNISKIQNEIEKNSFLFNWSDWKRILNESMLKWHVERYEKKEAFQLNRESYVIFGGNRGCIEAYRFFRLLDRLALPLRCGNVTLLGNIEHPWIEAILELNDMLGVFMLCRSTKKSIIETIISRKYVIELHSKQAECILDFLVKSLSKSLNEIDEFGDRPRGILQSILSNVPEMLRRYSSRASQQMQERLLYLLKELMEKEYLPVDFPMAQLCCEISEVVAESVKAKLLNELLQTKIVEHKNMHAQEAGIDIFEYYFRKEDIGPLLGYCDVPSTTIEQLLVIPDEYGYEWKTKVVRLEVLYNLGLLSEEQKYSYAKLLWKYVSEKTGLPKLENMHWFVFEKMPCLDSTIPTHSLKSLFLCKNLLDVFQDKEGCEVTMGHIPYLQELTLLCDKSETGYWSVEEADALLNNIQNYWMNLRKIWNRNNKYKIGIDEYSMRAKRMVETVAAILRNVGQVSLECEEKIRTMVLEMKELGISTKEIEIQISKDSFLILQIILDMRSMDDSVAIGAIKAAYEYIKSHPDYSEESQALLDELFNIIRYCKTPGLLSALYIIHNLVYINSPIMNEVNIETLDNILFCLYEHLQNNSFQRMKLKEVILARKACVSISFQVYKTEDEKKGKGVQLWKRVVEDEEEVNEVKNEWVYF